MTAEVAVHGHVLFLFRLSGYPRESCHTEHPGCVAQDLEMG